jgi:NHLM bacteriocin system ABC transporter ATP-binding protein
MNKLSQHLDKITQPVPVDKVFWLDQYPTIDYIETGAVDVFLQKRNADSKPEGPRYHLYRLEEGLFLFGNQQIDLPDGWELVAVRLAATTVRRLNADTFSDLLKDKLLNDEVVSIIKKTIINYLQVLKDELAPQKYVSIQAGEKLEIQENDVVSCSESLIWTRILNGQTAWCSKKEFPLDGNSGLIPLSRDTYLKADSSSTIEALSFDALTENVGPILQSVQLIQKMIAIEGLGDIDKKALLENNQLQNMPGIAQAAMSQALSKLFGMVHHYDEHLFTHHAELAILKALAPIGKIAGIVFKSPHPAELKSKAFQTNPLECICNASDVRYRQVAMVDGWWTTDNGPILAQYEESKEWVALLPVKDKSYELYDPSSGQRKVFTEELSHQLAPFGFVFYRSFPNQKITPFNLVTFGAIGIKRDLILVLLLSLLTGLLAMVVPIVTGKLIDTVIPSAEKSQILQVVAALLIAAVSATIFEIATLISVLRIESKMDGSVQAAVWDRVLKLPVTFFRKYSTGDLATRISGINTIRHALSGATIKTILSGVFSIFNFGLLFHYNSKLATIATFWVIVILLVIAVIGFLKLRYERQMAQVDGKLSSITFEFLTGLVKIRIFSAENQVFSRWAELYSKHRNLMFNTHHLANIEHTVFSGVPIIISASFFSVMGVFLFEHGEGTTMTSGAFIAFTAAFGAFLAGMIGLVETVMSLLNLVPIYERTTPILHSLPEVNENKIHPGEVLGEINIDKLSFRYGDGDLILDDISLKIASGEYVALVGSSGSGKSTLLRLLLGFEKPVSGSIYFDNLDMNEVDINALRRQFGVVLQNAQLLPGDIFSNIVGSSNLTVEDAWDAARMVGLDKDIEKMPMGMYTVIGEGGTTFSGGQRQRMIIAKAIVHRPRILFFDEATSALDNHTQAIVTNSLEQFKSTRIVIAHRMSTIVKADRIIVLNKGKIVQDGSYEKLMSVDGLFKELASRQTT